MSELNPAQLQEALDKSPSSVRITDAYINGRIDEVEYTMWPETTTTLCMIKLDNGFQVIGHSACVDPKNFNPDIGKTLAREKAYAQLKQLFGFALAECWHAAKLQEHESEFLAAVGMQDGE